MRKIQQALMTVDKLIIKNGNIFENFLQLAARLSTQLVPWLVSSSITVNSTNTIFQCTRSTNFTDHKRLALDYQI